MANGHLLFFTGIKAWQIPGHRIIDVDLTSLSQQHQAGGGSYYLGQRGEIKKSRRIHFRSRLDWAPVIVIFLGPAIGHEVDRLSVSFDPYHSPRDQIGPDSRPYNRIHSLLQQDNRASSSVLPIGPEDHGRQHSSQKQYLD